MQQNLKKKSQFFDASVSNVKNVPSYRISELYVPGIETPQPGFL